MQSVINASGSYFITRETHYFDDLRDRYSDKGNIGYGSADIKECEDYFLALSHRPYGHKGDPALGQMSRSELWGRARALGGQADAFFEAYCRMEAEGTGSSGWGEKTPRHVYRIAEMVEAFPDARFVCVVRDPRAVVASYKTWRYRGGFNFDNDSNHEEAMRADYERARRSYSLLLISMMW
ncbi:MAG: sulfotransferase, partial [Planctomycetota bacterium]|nr:sulfotransferase [Planctomycetota bacterium]